MLVSNLTVLTIFTIHSFIPYLAACRILVP